MFVVGIGKWQLVVHNAHEIACPYNHYTRQKTVGLSVREGIMPPGLTMSQIESVVHQSWFRD